MMDEIRPWFFLKSVPGIGNHLFKRLLDRFGSPAQALDAPDADLQAVEGMSRSLIGRMKSHRLPDRVKQDIQRVREKNIRIVTMNDPEYPQLLIQIPDPPPFLYVHGRLEKQTKAVAMVGSRMATRYGLSVARRLSAELAACGLTVVSGMARGIDTAAHQGALEGGGRTIAVLGSGLDRIYPAQNRNLAGRIIGNGAVITEFPMATEPEPHNFPVRNRIISGMSFGTVIVEATKKSGSLITARLAAEQNREVFAVPGSVQSFKSTGTHTLIKQGAKLVENVQDILEEIAGAVFVTHTPDTGRSLPAQKAIDLSPEEAMVCGSLDTYPIHIDDLGRRTALAPGKLSSILLALELKGLVEQLPGKLFVLVDDEPFQHNL
jgi:DNA processing protein